MTLRPRLVLLAVALFALTGVKAAFASAGSGHACVPGARTSAAGQSLANDAHVSHAAPPAGAVARAASASEAGAMLSVDQQCPHCAHPQCATSQHCAAPVSAARSGCAILPDTPSSSWSPAHWVPARPLSVNLTPPIPPPQTIL